MKTFLKNGAKRIAFFIAVVLFMGCVVPGQVSAIADDAAQDEFAGASGNTEDYSWSIDKDGHLLITGDALHLDGAPPKWISYSSYIQTATVDLSGKSTGLHYMFLNCMNLISVEFKKFDTSLVTDMSYMFYQCHNLRELDLSGFQTQSVTDMSYMFYRCLSLPELDLSSFQTGNLQKITCMFYLCQSLKKLDLSMLDLSNLMDGENYVFSYTDINEIILPNLATELGFGTEYYDEEGNLVSKAKAGLNRPATYYGVSYMLSDCFRYGHSYERPRFTWETLPDVKLILECEDKKCHKGKDAYVEVEAVVTKDISYATVDKEGYIKYCATAQWNGKTYSDELRIPLAKQNQTTQTPGVQEQEPETKLNAIAVGSTFIYNGAKYKVTAANGTKREVSYVSPVKKTVKKVTIPNTVVNDSVTYKVTAVSAGALKNNKKLTGVSIGKYVTQIGKNAFYGCKKLKTVTMKTKKLKTIGKGAWKGIYKKAKFDVPNSKLKAYRKLFAKKTGFQSTMLLK